MPAFAFGHQRIDLFARVVPALGRRDLLDHRGGSTAGVAAVFPLLGVLALEVHQLLHLGHRRLLAIGDASLALGDARFASGHTAGSVELARNLVELGGRRVERGVLRRELRVDVLLLLLELADVTAGRLDLDDLFLQLRRVGLQLVALGDQPVASCDELLLRFDRRWVGSGLRISLVLAGRREHDDAQAEPR
jgi:hypothetical protein